MSLKILLKDEIRGFIKTKVMMSLFIGLPLLSLLFRTIQMDTEGIPASTLTALLLGTVGGTLASVLLGTNISTEIQNHVYDLFLIRPVKRWHLIISKYIAVYVLLIGGTIFSMSISVLYDTIQGTYSQVIFLNDLESLIVVLSMMSLASSFGIIIGTFAKSVAVSAILSIYLGNQLTALLMLPATFIEGLDPSVFTPIIAYVATAAMLYLAVLRFNKKQF